MPWFYAKIPITHFGDNEKCSVCVMWLRGCRAFIDDCQEGFIVFRFRTHFDNNLYCMQHFLSKQTIHSVLSYWNYSVVWKLTSIDRHDNDKLYTLFKYLPYTAYQLRRSTLPRTKVFNWFLNHAIRDLAVLNVDLVKWKHIIFTRAKVY